MGDITEVVQIGVGCVVMDNEGRFLLSERLAPKHGHGLWSFPGGKPDPGESPTETALRELEEETGIKSDYAQPLGVWTYERWPEQQLHFCTLYFMIDALDQQPQDREPDKHGPWEWVSGDDAFARYNLFGGVARVMSLLG